MVPCDSTSLGAVLLFTETPRAALGQSGRRIPRLWYIAWFARLLGPHGLFTAASGRTRSMLADHPSPCRPVDLVGPCVTRGLPKHSSLKHRGAEATEKRSLHAILGVLCVSVFLRRCFPSPTRVSTPAPFNRRTGFRITLLVERVGSAGGELTGKQNQHGIYRSAATHGYCAVLSTFNNRELDFSLRRRQHESSRISEGS